MTRRSKLRVNTKEGRGTTWPSRTAGRSLTKPKETPKGQDQVAATASTPYLAGELTRTAPPLYFAHRLGKKYGNRIRIADSQFGNRRMMLLNSRHCLLFSMSATERARIQSVISLSESRSASRSTSTKATPSE